ncbi:MAG: hypothetical protein ACOX3Q_07750 [Clostridia bacterium]|jgi:uncharacterized protein with PIN domain
MFCSNCGHEITGNFCSNCGAPIGESQGEPVEKPVKKSFWERLKDQVKEEYFSEEVNRQALKERAKQLDKEGIAYCPKCYSTSLSAHKKGFGIGKAVVGASLTGGIGLMAGNIGSKKVRVTCLKCGHQFWAGKK